MVLSVVLGVNVVLLDGKPEMVPKSNVVALVGGGSFEAFTVVSK